MFDFARLPECDCARAVRRVVGYFLTLSLGVGAPLTAQQTSPFDMQASCDASSKDARVFSPGIPKDLPSASWAFDIEVKPRELLSVDWDPTTKGPVLVDTRESQVKWLAPDGTRRLTVGRPGQGPGDLQFPAVYVGSRQKLALLGSRGTVVIDGARGSLFSKAGKFVNWFAPDSSRTAMGADVQVSRVNDSTIVVSQSNRWHMGESFEQRTLLRLVSWHVDASGVTRPKVIGILRNPAIMFKPFTAILPNEPYARLHQRTWGIGRDVISALPYSFFGLCRFAIGSGKVATSVLRALPRPTSKAEQDRELKLEYGSDPDAVMPGMSSSPRALMEDHWPVHAPFYYDILVSPEGRSIAVRLGNDGGVIADVYDEVGAYRESIRLSVPLVLYAFVGRTLIALDTDKGMLEGFVIL